MHSGNRGSIDSLTKYVRSVNLRCRARVADERVERVGHGTVNRMMRAHDRMHDFFAKSEASELSDFFTAQVDRVEKQAALLRALCTLSTSRWLHLPAQRSPSARVKREADRAEIKIYKLPH